MVINFDTMNYVRTFELVKKHHGRVLTVKHAGSGGGNPEFTVLFTKREEGRKMLEDLYDEKITAEDVIEVYEIEKGVK